MASEHASHANRQNAAKSTGPRTPSEKAQSKLSARKHGFLIVDLDLEMKAEIKRLIEPYCRQLRHSGGSP
jgi:hypothetical protein